MPFTLRTGCAYAVCVPTSMGVRITPHGGQPVHTSDTFFMHATSAETNAATVSSSLGMPALALTSFVKDSPIATLIKRDLRSRNIDYIGPEVAQGGPWGYRHQFNIADSGFGVRGPRVHNDRAGEVGRTLNVKDFDLAKIFGEQGVQILHMSGLIAALSPESGEFCLALAKAAKKHGTAISFDMNFRATFWEGREKELGELFREITANADILGGNEEDFQLCLGAKGPESGGKELSSQISGFKEMIEGVQKTYPNVSVFATTLRQVISANRHLWGALLCMDGRWVVEEPREIDVLDRIGGGDGFIGGLLYGLLKGYDAEKCNQLGWASGALATTVLTDFAQPADECQLLDIYEGNARVKR